MNKVTKLPSGKMLDMSRFEGFFTEFMQIIDRKRTPEQKLYE